MRGSAETRGFTLIEILLIVVIIGIIAAIALPSFLSSSDQAYDAEVRQYLVVSNNTSKLVWREHSALPPLGNHETLGTLIYELTRAQPQLKFVNVVGDRPTDIQISPIDDHRIVFAGKSLSGKIFCLEGVYQNVETVDGTVKAGHYWAYGPVGSVDPCGVDAESSQGPDGAQPFPDPPSMIGVDDETPEPEEEEKSDGLPIAEIFDIEDADVLSEGLIRMESNAVIRSDVATNETVDMDWHAQICGNVKVGEGQIVQGNGNISCGGQVANGTVTIPHYSVAPTDNDNPVTWDVDTYSGCCENPNPFNPNSRALELKAHQEVVLRGDTYVFCAVDVAPHAQVVVANQGEHVTIYLDKPENCNNRSNQFILRSSNSYLAAHPSQTPASITVVALGSTTVNSTFEVQPHSSINPGCRTELYFYAPLSNGIMRSNAHVCGSFAAKMMTVQPHAVIEDGN